MLKIIETARIHKSRKNIWTNLMLLVHQLQLNKIVTVIDNQVKLYLINIQITVAI